MPPNASGPLFNLVNEVLELIKEKVGVEQYFKAYHIVRDQVQEIRMNRKNALAREAVRGGVKALLEESEEAGDDLRHVLLCGGEVEVEELL